MSGSDFTHGVDASGFTCERGTVQCYFVVADKDVGKRFLYTLEEAADLGQIALANALWMHQNKPSFERGTVGSILVFTS